MNIIRNGLFHTHNLAHCNSPFKEKVVDRFYIAN